MTDQPLRTAHILSTQGQENPWTILTRRVAYQNPYFSVDDYEVLKPNGAPGFYGVARFKRVGVGVLPIDDSGNVYLVGQWRFAVDAYSWEMPEGGAEPEEDPRACAARELEEEAGLKAGRLIEALQVDISNSITDERGVVFIAVDLTAGVLHPDDTEVFDQAKVHFKEALAAALDGRIRDALTVAALLRAHHMAVTGGLPAPLAQAMLR